MSYSPRYNTGNLDKHQTKNPVKRFLVTRFNRKMMRILSGIDFDRILDAGCGEGFVSKLLKDTFPNATVIGLDHAEEALAFARKQNEGIEFIQGNLYDMQFDNQSFDLVVCSEVLEHLANPEKAVKELERVASNYLLITVPREPWFCLGNLLALHNVTRLGNPIDHINHWTFRRFKRYMRQLLASYNLHFSTSFPWSIVLVNVVQQPTD